MPRRKSPDGRAASGEFEIDLLYNLATATGMVIIGFTVASQYRRKKCPQGCTPG